jgi:hypothetical protein
VSYQHLFETDTDAGPVEVSRNAVLALAGHRFELSDDWGLVGQGGYQLSSFHGSRQ